MWSTFELWVFMGLYIVLTFGALFATISLQKKWIKQLYSRLGKKLVSRNYNVAGWQILWPLAMLFMFIGMPQKERYLYALASAVILPIILFLQAFILASTPKQSSRKIKSNSVSKYPKIYSYLYWVVALVWLVMTLVAARFLAILFFQIQKDVYAQDAVYFLSFGPLLAWFLLFLPCGVLIAGLLRFVLWYFSRGRLREFIAQPKGLIDEKRFGMDWFRMPNLAKRQILLGLGGVIICFGSAFVVSEYTVVNMSGIGNRSVFWIT